MAIDWGGLLGDALGAGAAVYGANQNTNAAQSAQQAGQFKPYNIYGPQGTAQFNGTNINLGMDPGTQQLMQQLQQGGQGLFGQYLNSQSQPGSLNELAGEHDYANQYTDPTTFMQLGDSFLNQLGSTDPNQLASQYAGNLRQIDAQGENTAANSLANRLFSQGRLGSTGGQGMFGQLMNQQNLAQVNRQVAGQQYGQQSQNNMAALGSNLLNTGYGRVQDRFARAQTLFNANQGNQNSLLSGFQAALGQGNNMNGNLLNMASLGANVGQGAAATNFAAAQPVLNASQSQNAAIYGGLGNILGGIDWGGLMNRAKTPQPVASGPNQLGPL